MLARAHLARAGLLSGSGPLSEADWAQVRQLPATEAAWGKLPTAHGPLLAAMLGPEREATIEKLGEDDRESFAAGVHDLVMRLAEPLEFEANRLGRALFARWSRVSVLSLILVVAAGLGTHWLIKRYGPQDLALHRPVTVSSQYPGQGTDHTLLVDGDTENLGFHTENNGQQWVIIDLGKVYPIHEIVVYNRADGYQERAVPLKVQVSNDNKHYTQIAERKKTFDKWTVKGLHAEGRYVRLENTPPNYFHLAEVEVY